MPSNIDILFERLKQFDEVTLLELLDITAEDILERFKDKIMSKKETLYGEVELLSEDEEEGEEELDGYQVANFEDDDYVYEDWEDDE